jgi:RNA polymerase sigma-70 factor, ECF subfamily
MALDCDTAIRTLTAQRLSLLGWIRAMGCDENLAEDVYQDVSVLVVQKCGEIVDVQHFGPWMRNAARLKALEALRARKKIGLLLDDRTLDLIESEWQSLSPTGPGDLLRWLRECVDQLSPYVHQLIELRFIDGLSGSALAEKMGRERNTVYVALTRAYKTLADCIRRHQAQEEAGDE